MGGRLPFDNLLQIAWGDAIERADFSGKVRVIAEAKLVGNVLQGAALANHPASLYGAVVAKELLGTEAYDLFQRSLQLEHFHAHRRRNFGDGKLKLSSELDEVPSLRVTNLKSRARKIVATGVRGGFYPRHIRKRKFRFL